MQVGFIGLGSQGGGMAHAIARSEHTLRVWARRPAVLHPFVDAGAIAEASAAALAAASELVCLCVTSERDVADVLFEQSLVAAMRPGSILAIHSTISPAACRAFAIRAEEFGVHVVDAPVSGGGEAARNGQLLVMLGGDPDTLARARPVLSCFGNRLVQLGPVGAGQSAKIINNLLFLANFGAAKQALSLGPALGLDGNALREALANGSASSRALEAFDYLTSPKMAANIAPILNKDFALARELARKCGHEIDALDQAGVVALAHLAEILKLQS
jgi:3-hydroxyisobutyrate dehydrogenase